MHIEQKDTIPHIVPFLKQEDPIISFAPFGLTFGIREPYTDAWDVLRSHDYKYEELVEAMRDMIPDNVIIPDTLQLFSFPFLQYVHNKMRLGSLLWLPYVRYLEEMCRHDQIEFYILEASSNSKIRYLLIPLRIDWHLSKGEKQFNFRKLDGFDYPTFALDTRNHGILFNAIGHAHGVHFFHYYERGQKKIPVPVTNCYGVENIIGTKTVSYPATVTAVQFMYHEDTSSQA